MNNKFWNSTALGGVLAGLVWSVFPQAEKVVKEVVVHRETRSKVRSGRGVSLPPSMLQSFARSSAEKMEIIELLSEASFDDLERQLEDWEDGQGGGVVWKFADRMALTRMGELDAKRAWLWVDRHRIGDRNRDSAEEWKTEIEAEWAFRDLGGLLTFLKGRGEEQADYKLVPLDALIPGDPGRWVNFYLERKKEQGSFVAEARFISSLQDGEECRDALRVFREEGGEPNLNSLVQGVIRRWREVDEVGFTGSGFVGWEKVGE